MITPPGSGCASTNCTGLGASVAHGHAAVGPASHRTADPSVRSGDLQHSCPQRGTIGRTWSRREATYGPHDIHINDSSQPYDLRAHNPLGLISCVGVEVPKKLLPLPRSRTDQLVGRRLRGQDGIGALLGGTLTHLTTDTSSYLHSDGPRLSTVLVDLVAALFGHGLEADTLPPETHQHSMVLRIRSFIQQNLHHSQLTPDAVAAAHHISTSYLHRTVPGKRNDGCRMDPPAAPGGCEPGFGRPRPRHRPHRTDRRPMGISPACRVQPRLSHRLRGFTQGLPTPPPVSS